MNKLKSIVYFFSLFTFFSTLAQDAENQYLINLLKQKKEEIHNEERELLKLKIKEVNEQLYKETISQETADSLKLLYAKETAKSIEEKQLNAETDIFQKKIDTNSKHLFSVEIQKNYDYDYSRIENRYLRTSDLVLAFGLNHLIDENHLLEETPYEYLKLWFAEIGWALKTKLIPNFGFVNLRYGFSFQINKLRPKNDQIFYNNDGIIELKPYGSELKRNNLIYTNLVFPIHLELGSRTQKYTVYNQNGNYKRYRHNRSSLIVGAGVYGGFNIQNSLKIKVENHVEKLKSDLNFNDIVYGVSGYLSLPNVVTLYGKADLSMLFKNQPFLHHNVSLGIRFDIN